MLTKRERNMLNDINRNVDITYLIKDLTDQDIKEHLLLLNGFKVFNESDRIVDILMKLTNDEIKIIFDDDYTKLHPIPKNLEFDQVLSLINRGVSVYNHEFTEKYWYRLSRDKNLLIKYKHLICFETLIRCPIYKNTNILECYYDELVKVSTSVILDTLGFKLSDEPIDNIHFSLLIDRLNFINKRQFKDEELIKVFLENIKYEDIRDEKLIEIFKYFDDDYIKQNIDYFDPLQLKRAGRLTEDIYQVILDKNNKDKFSKYNPEVYKLQEEGMTELSLEFLIKNISILKTTNLELQKNALELYKIYLDTINLGEVYFYNSYLSQSDLEYILNELFKDKEKLCKSIINTESPKIINNRLSELINYINNNSDYKE